MKIIVKLYATLSDYLPPDARGRQASVEVAEGATIHAALAALAVPARLTHIVMVNGRFVPLGERDRRPLAEGDELAVWPAVGGG